MAVREHFSVTTAGGFVLAGIAAVILATVIAVGGYGRSKAPASLGSSGAAGAPGEYLLDVSDVTDGSKLP